MKLAALIVLVVALFCTLVLSVFAGLGVLMFTQTDSLALALGLIALVASPVLLLMAALTLYLGVAGYRCILEPDEAPAI